MWLILSSSSVIRGLPHWTHLQCRVPRGSEPQAAVFTLTICGGDGVLKIVMNGIRKIDKNRRWSFVVGRWPLRILPDSLNVSVLWSATGVVSQRFVNRVVEPRRRSATSVECASRVHVCDGALANDYQRPYFEAAASWRTVVMKVSVARVRVRSRR